jgi:hypothetical protein
MAWSFAGAATARAGMDSVTAYNAFSTAVVSRVARRGASTRSETFG